MQTSKQQAPTSIEEIENAQNQAFVQKLVGKFFAIWPWLIVSVVVCLGLSFAYLKISSPEYKVHASVLVQDDKKSTNFGEANILQDFGMFGQSNVDNEAEVFKSRSLMEQVVTNLHLNVRYYVSGKVKTTEIYTSRPVNFNFIYSPDSSLKSTLYNLQFDKANITNFTLSNEETTYTAHFGDTITLKKGKAVITPGPGYSKWAIEEPVSISLNSIDAVTQSYMAALSVDIPNKQVSVIHLTLNETIPAKGEVILNTLISSYMQANVNDKNRIADSTMNFIDERLKLVSSELSAIEKDIEGFKTTNKLTDLSAQARILLENNSEYQLQQTSQEVQLSVIEALEQFLKNNINNARVVPSSLVMQDPGFIALLNRYNETQLQRDRMLMSLTPSHPSILTVDEQLGNLRQELLSSIVSVKKGIEVSVVELRKRTSGFEGQIRQVPAKERTFLDYSRQQSIKQELYLFLLKKREETAVSKSATIASARVIDMGKSDSSPFAPKKNMIFFLGFAAGLVLPFMISFGKDMLNTRVATANDISAITHVPILSEIGHNNEEKVIAVTANSRQLIAEQFRSLRTNLKYLLANNHEKTILVTSSMSGEGKSFLSINLCTTIAMAGRKTILLEMDLRKPKISNNLDLTKEGFTNYIISDDNNWQKWVQPSGVQENFDVLPCGPLPPNPAELLMMPKVATLFKELKEHYDYIIIDSPPAGIVTDAEILASHSDATFYIIRYKYTFKQQIHLIERFFQKRALPRMHIIINDMQVSKAPYGYHYGYASSYGAYGEESKKKRLKAINK